MSHPARLSLRAPPHLPFVQGFPGIPANGKRQASSIEGTLELRIGQIPVKAKWVRVELRKFEALPPGFPSVAVEESWEHVGSIQTLWQPQGGKEWEGIQTADFKFNIPLPADMPPSIDLPRGAGVRYELVAALCYRQKGGVFKKESAPIVKVTERIPIIKHELHSAWPVYNMLETRVVKVANGQMELTVSRACTAFSAADTAQFTATLKSLRPVPFKLLGFECSLIEIITYIPAPPDPAVKSKKRQISLAPVIKSRVVQTMRAALDENMGLGGVKSADVPFTVGNVLVTVRGAKTLEVQYELEVRAVMEGVADRVEMKGIRCTVGTFMRKDAVQAIRDIGHVISLCPDLLDKPLPPRTASFQPPPVRPASNGITPPSSYHRPPTQPVQGFTPRVHRRQSSVTSFNTDTTTTATTATHEFGGNVNGRGYQTAPHRRSDLAFPSPQPHRPSSVGPESPVNSVRQERNAASDMGHGDESWKRYSTGTSATFGRWDMGSPKIETRHLRAASDITQTPTTPTSSTGPPLSTPPVMYSYQSAEQEKRRHQELYNSARARAAQVQEASGAALDRLGLSPSPSSKGIAVAPKPSFDGSVEEDMPPPEYAPPLPAQPAEYKAPEKPVAAYTERNSPHPSVTTPPVSGSKFGSASPSPPSSARSTSKPPVISDLEDSGQLYMSAAQEKETQKKRYEQAVSRTQTARQSLSNGSRPPSAMRTASTSTPVQDIPRSSSVGTSSALSTLTEKEQMRLYYEARDRVAAAAGGGSSSQSTVSSSPPPPKQSAVLVAPALSEKEQMRRYYDAQDKVAAASGSGSGSARDRNSQRLSQPPPAATSPSSKPLDEKEQMRRYYEAQDRVARAAKRNSGEGEKTTQAEPSSSRSRAASSNVRTVSGAGAEEEKAQMRRYHEAQERVAAAASSAGEHGSNTGSGTSTPKGSVAVPSTYPAQPSTVSLPRLDEKEQMRRYYEAQDRVARAAGSARGEGSSSQAKDDSDVPPPGFDVTPSSSHMSLSGHLSAEEEKARMRERFEAAQAAVQRSSPGRPLPSNNSSRPTTANGRSLSMTMSPASSPPESSFARDPAIIAGKAKTLCHGSEDGHGQGSSSMAGPPPPLPAKPPKDYINLLNSVGEREEFS